MVRYASDRRLFTYMHTNATLLTQKLSAELIGAGLDSISFSFDGDNPETYEANRVGAKYDRTLENILGFLREKQKSGGNRPVARIQMIGGAAEGDACGNGGVSPEFKALFEGLPLDYFHRIPPFNLRGEKTDIDLPRSKEYFPCFQLWAGMSIAWNGKVVGCCADLNARHIIGDLNRQTILEVWNSDALMEMRRLLIAGDYKRVPLCAECSYLVSGSGCGFKPLPFAKGLVKDLIT